MVTEYPFTILGSCIYDVAQLNILSMKNGRWSLIDWAMRLINEKNYLKKMLFHFVINFYSMTKKRLWCYRTSRQLKSSVSMSMARAPFAFAQHWYFIWLKFLVVSPYRLFADQTMWKSTLFIFINNSLDKFMEAWVII